jgi:hypothetical protein
MSRMLIHHLTSRSFDLHIGMNPHRLNSCNVRCRQCCNRCCFLLRVPRKTNMSDTPSSGFASRLYCSDLASNRNRWYLPGTVKNSLTIDKKNPRRSCFGRHVESCTNRLVRNDSFPTLFDATYNLLCRCKCLRSSNPYSKPVRLLSPLLRSK